MTTLHFVAIGQINFQSLYNVEDLFIIHWCTRWVMKHINCFVMSGGNAIIILRYERNIIYIAKPHRFIYIFSFCFCKYFIIIVRNKKRINKYTDLIIFFRYIYFVEKYLGLKNTCHILCINHH